MSQDRKGSGLSMFRRRAVGWFQRKIGVYAKYSYAQCGEDLIIRHIFDSIGIATPSYLDLGAHHPFYLNNTALFYQTGSRGVNVEPDPELYDRFKGQRQHDVNLGIGVGPQERTLEFFVMSSRTLNTFSEKEAQRYVRECGIKIDKVLSVPVLRFDQIVDQYCDGIPDFISLDVEGLDFEVLSSIDFNRYLPHVICVETLDFHKFSELETPKQNIIGELLDRAGYLKYADTYINTIFIHRDSWNKQ